MKLPTVTFALLSWNRLHYLRATLESALACIDYPNMEWIVSDNDSIEPGLQEYLRDHPRIDKLLIKKQSHAEAMNELIQTASGRYIFIWPEDVQFIVRGDWLHDLVELLESHDDLGSIGIDAIRTCTLKTYFHSSVRQRVQWARRDLKHFSRIRKTRTLTSSRGYRLRTLGGATPGVCGSGIPTLTRTSTWKDLGGWQQNTEGTSRLIDSSLGAEDNMVAQFYHAAQPLQMAIPEIPVAADIITDSSGCKAKVRGPYRFGDYMPPCDPNSPFYYKLKEPRALPAIQGGLPLSFFDIVDPLGFSLPRDGDGDRLKSSLNTTIVYDIEKERPIPHALRNSDVVNRIR